MNEMQTQQSQNNEVSMPEVLPPAISRKRTLADFEAILPLDAPERVLNVHGGGGLGKTWFLKDLRIYCDKHDLLHNKQLIDFYDTAHHRVSGLITSIIQELDPNREFFGPYLKIRAEFDRLRAQGFGGRALEKLGKEMDCAFFTALQELGTARRRLDGKKGVVLLLDTYEVVKDGRVGRWLLEDLLGQTENICAVEDNPPPIMATQDVAVVIAGRPRIDESRTQAPIRFCSPGNFSPEEINQYVQELFGRYKDLPFDAEDMEALILWIVDRTGGVPVVVALALDLANLYISAYHDTPALSGEGLLSVLQEAERRGDLATGLIEQIVDLLGSVPEQQWAILYMTHLRRRFTQRLYSALQGKPPSHIGSLSAFEHLYMTKYRHLRGTFRLPSEEVQQFEEATVSLHDWIRERAYRRYWQGSIPVNTVVQGRSAGVFPPDLDDLWNQACDWESAPSEIPCENLRPILRWLDDKAIEFYEAHRHKLREAQAQIDREADPSRWVEYEYQQHALMAEQLLYELDRDMEVGWRHWRRAYDEAFESYQQGYCEQLELTILSAWSEQELSSDASEGPRRSEIRRMATIRQIWWRIRHGEESRERAIQYLESFCQDPEEGKQKELLADVLSALGWAYALEGDSDRAIACREQAATLYKALGFSRDRERVLNFLGESYAKRGDFWQADECWTEALEIARQQEPKDEAEIASVAMKLAYYKNLAGELGPALGYTKVAEELFQRVGDSRRLGAALNYQGRVYLANGRFRHAYDALQEAEKLLKRVGDPEDIALLRISWGEFYRRRATSSDQAKEEDFNRSQEQLTGAIQMIMEEKAPEYCKIEAQGELGTLFRDRAHQLADFGQLDAARRAWAKAEELLKTALEWAEVHQVWFKVADFLDDLCELHAEQHRFGIDSRPALEVYLDKLEKVACKRNYPRYLSRLAERRAELLFEDKEYEKAIGQYIQACEAIGVQTHAGRKFRDVYDTLVERLEEQLRNLPSDQEQATLAAKAIHLWARTGYADHYFQLVLACQRVFYVAQSRLDERAADIAFKEGRYDDAFYLYVQACDHIGQLTTASHSYYAMYSALLSKLERRLYDLNEAEKTLHYSQYVEEDWHRLGNTAKHWAMLEICQRTQEMARLILETVA
jgi:tetratricopeptide (TPR) repeat protein